MAGRAVTGESQNPRGGLGVRVHQHRWHQPATERCSAPHGPPCLELQNPRGSGFSAAWSFGCLNAGAVVKGKEKRACVHVCPIASCFPHPTPRSLQEKHAVPLYDHRTVYKDWDVVFSELWVLVPAAAATCSSGQISHCARGWEMSSAKS